MNDYKNALVDYEANNWDKLVDGFVAKHYDQWLTYLEEQYNNDAADAAEQMELVDPTDAPDPTEEPL
jgi:hypothetical protein